MPSWTFEVDEHCWPVKPPPVTMAGQELHSNQVAKVEAIISDCIVTAIVRRTCMGEIGLRPTDVLRAYERAAEKAKMTSEHWMAHVLHRAHHHLWSMKEEGIRESTGLGFAERLEALEGKKGKAA